MANFSSFGDKTFIVIEGMSQSVTAAEIFAASKAQKRPNLCAHCQKSAALCWQRRALCDRMQQEASAYRNMLFIQPFKSTCLWHYPSLVPDKQTERRGGRERRRRRGSRQTQTNSLV